MNLACSVDELPDITLVELDVTNPTRTTRRIRIENTLAGDVLPPRHHGTPVDGWDEEGVTLSIDAGEHRALGYACQAVPESPPARIVGSEPTERADTSSRSPGTVLTALGDPRPPRDVVEPELRDEQPERAVGSEKQDMVTDRDGDSGETERRPEGIGSDHTACETGRTEVPEGNERVETGPPERNAREGTPGADQQAIPPAIDAWLQRKSERIAAGDPVNRRVLRAVSHRTKELATRTNQ